ncbi:MAG: hypothetical protein SWJ54_15420 [Cyanobacteriota bacterium]|nr:hypothetical protein [Cyanobacteriota bacterium]
MGCFTRIATAVTLVAGTQFTFVDMAQAGFQPQNSVEGSLCKITSTSLERVTCPFNQNQNQELPPNATGRGGGR